MKKRILSLVVVLVWMVSVFAGCGGSKSAADETVPSVAVTQDVKPDGSQNADIAAAAVAEDKDVNGNNSVKEKAKGAEKSSSSIIGSGSKTQSVSNAILAQRKVIRNANISVEVEDFDKAYGQIKSMISAYGFVQESSVKKQKDYENHPITNGIIIIRVDRDKFDEVVMGIKGLGDLIDENIKSDDVTDKYYDTESRLRLLRFEESRLEEYLKKINDPDTIFKTESRLTDIRHEIESLTGTLKKWNDLVALSTITINLYEKSEAVSNIPVVKSYSNRLSESFTGSMKGVVNFFGELVIVLAASVPVLAVISVLVWLGFLIYRKYNRGKKKRSINTNKEDGIQI